MVFCAKDRHVAVALTLIGLLPQQLLQLLELDLQLGPEFARRQTFSGPRA